MIRMGNKNVKSKGFFKKIINIRIIVFRTFFFFFFNNHNQLQYWIQPKRNSVMLMTRFENCWNGVKRSF